MSVKTQIDRINGEVATQEGLIAQIRDVVNTLPEAGGGGDSASTVLFGTYQFKSRLESPNVITEISFSSGQVKTYFLSKNDGERTFEDISKIVFTEPSVEFIPSDSSAYYKKVCTFNSSSYDQWTANDQLTNDVVSLINDGWELIITFMEPITLSSSDYNALTSMIAMPLENPYDSGYAFGYNEGYTECESNMGPSGEGFPSFYFQDDTGLEIIVNGSTGGIAPVSTSGVASLILPYASLEEAQAILIYGVPYDGTSDIFDLSSMWSQIDGTDTIIGIVPSVDFLTEQTYGLLFTTEPLL